VSGGGRSDRLAARLHRRPEGVYLDVRGLDCPDPLVEILGLIDRGEAGDALIVDLDQEPFFLYPELEARGWGHERLLLQDDGGHDACRLRLEKRGP